MSKRVLKFIHFASTAWLGLCVGYLLVLALRQAGFNWWVIFSFSGHSLLLVILFINLYLFAIFKGFDRNQKIEVEHPLTTMIYYDIFYDLSPFLGALAGCMGMIGVSKASDLPLGIALGTLGATFLMWIIVDPAIVFSEKLLPASRKHRLERLAKARALRQEQREKQKELLAEILAQNEQEQRRRQKELEPQAEKLAALLATCKNDFEQAEREGVEIGVKAWQLGGLSCMEQLRDMATDFCKKQYTDSIIVDYISTWWDGIGSWRNSSLA